MQPRNPSAGRWFLLNAWKDSTRIRIPNRQGGVAAGEGNGIEFQSRPSGGAGWPHALRPRDKSVPGRRLLCRTLFPSASLILAPTIRGLASPFRSFCLAPLRSPWTLRGVTSDRPAIVPTHGRFCARIVAERRLLGLSMTRSGPVRLRLELRPVSFRSVSAFESRMPFHVIGEKPGGAAAVALLAICIRLLSGQVESAVALVLDGNGRS